MPCNAHRKPSWDQLILKIPILTSSSPPGLLRNHPCFSSFSASQRINMYHSYIKFPAGLKLFENIQDSNWIFLLSLDQYEDMHADVTASVTLELSQLPLTSHVCRPFAWKNPQTLPEKRSLLNHLTFARCYTPCRGFYN